MSHNDDMNDESERAAKDFNRKSGGSASSHYKKRLFDDITFEHKCTQAERPDVLRQCVSDSQKRVLHLLRFIIIWRDNPNTKKHFQSQDAVNKEIKRHINGNYWYIIHPYSCCGLCWNWLMTFVLYSLFLFIPFVYAFYQDLKLNSTIWSSTCGYVLNSFCYLDILLNCFTGYRVKNGNYIVLNQSLIISKYLRTSFCFDLLSILPFDVIFQGIFSGDGYVALISFHAVFALKFLRYFSFIRARNYLEDFMIFIKLSYIMKQIVHLILCSLMIIHFSVCLFMAASIYIFHYIYTSDKMSPFLNTLSSPDVAFGEKYYEIAIEYIIPIVFHTAYENDLSTFLPGKTITVGCMILGLTFNIYMFIQILNIVKIAYASKAKFYEIMNQLDAYMQMKQFPTHLQNRLKFFYRRKFRGAYFREDEILGILSEPLKREILINTDKVFVERVKLFQDIPSSIVSSIAAHCKKELFLPNDLVNSVAFKRHFRLVLYLSQFLRVCINVHGEIIKAGTTGECLFFIASGSVCVTSTNGQALCHLEDGDYFGEIAFILKNEKHIVSVSAIEFCEIYVLDYLNLEKFSQINETIMQKLTDTANERLKLIFHCEEAFKKQLHERTSIVRDSFTDEV